MTSHPKIILIGLPSTHAIIPEKMRDDIQKMLNETLPSKMSEAGIDFEFVPVSPEDGIEKFKSDLAARPGLDGVAIGYGVRGNADLTVYFEQLVNAIVEVSPKSKILFNSNPLNTVDAVRRWFP